MYYKNMTTTNRHMETSYPCFKGNGVSIQPSFNWVRNIADTNMNNVRKTFID